MLIPTGPQVLKLHLNNVKCHINTDFKILKPTNKSTQVKLFQNFYVYRNWGYCYVVYFHVPDSGVTKKKESRNGTINITGLKDFEEDPKRAFSLFCKHYLKIEVPQSISNFIVDSSSCDGKLFAQNINLYELFNKVNKTPTLHMTLSLRPHYFPGCVIRKKQCSGSIVLFSSGSFLILGSKSKKIIEERVEDLCNLLDLLKQ